VLAARASAASKARRLLTPRERVALGHAALVELAHGPVIPHVSVRVLRMPEADP